MIFCNQKGDVSETTIFLQIFGGEYSWILYPFLGVVTTWPLLGHFEFTHVVNKKQFHMLQKTQSENTNFLQESGFGFSGKLLFTYVGCFLCVCMCLFVLVFGCFCQFLVFCFVWRLFFLVVVDFFLLLLIGCCSFVVVVVVVVVVVIVAVVCCMLVSFCFVCCFVCCLLVLFCFVCCCSYYCFCF